MASITILLYLKVNANVTTPYKLLLDDKTNLVHGTWETNPPSTISPSNPPVVQKFKAKNRFFSWIGPEGTVYYKSTDSNNNPTMFIIYFDVPIWKKENTVLLTGGSEYFTLDLTGDFTSGSNPTATVTITQIGPVSIE